jgi:hypothetical protein
MTPRSPVLAFRSIKVVSQEIKELLSSLQKPSVLKILRMDVISQRRKKKAKAQAKASK